MGTTCASFHLMCGPSDAAKTVARAYAKLGYERLKKQRAGADKQVILFAAPGEAFVSVYDSTNAELDSGELKDAALAASKLLKAGAVMTSLYDSDAYEFVVFNSGRQVDLLMTDAENYGGPLKRLSGRARGTQWSKIFGRSLTSDMVDEASRSRSAFAEDAVVALSRLIGLPGDRPQRHFGDFASDGDAVTILHFAKKELPAGVADGQIVLRNYYDKDNSRKLLVWPAAWPMPVGREELLTWLMLSDGAGFRGGVAAIDVDGPEGLNFSSGIINGAKFHNGQIVGGYELPGNAPAEEARAYLESKRFSLEPVAADASARRYRAAFPNLFVPPWTPQRTTQILLVLQLHLAATGQGEWTVRVRLRPGDADGGPSFELPPARVAAVEQRWVPVVSGTNPKLAYDTADIEDKVPESAIEFVLHRSFPGAAAMAAAGGTAEARSRVEQGLAQSRERDHQTWLRDIPHVERRVSEGRKLDHPAVASNVVILRDEGRTTLDRCRDHLEEWLAPLASKGGLIRLNAERQMTDSFHIGKVKKQWPPAEVMRDKAWSRLFATEGEYQTIALDWLPDGSELPIAGAGASFTLRQPRSPSPRLAEQQADADAYEQCLLAATLGKMRGREFTQVEPGHTAHLFDWVLNADACWQALGRSAIDMKARLGEKAADASLLQAWHQDATWIPVFDRAEDYESTAYEETSALNYFRGILVGHKHGLKDWLMTAQWCANVLRTVAPLMFLCAGIASQLDRAALSRVATLSDADGRLRIEKRPDCPMDEFEIALLPILPIETVRLGAR
jgi:hypothetical protein